MAAAQVKEARRPGAALHLDSFVDSLESLSFSARFIYNAVVMHEIGSTVKNSDILEWARI